MLISREICNRCLINKWICLKFITLIPKKNIKFHLKCLNWIEMNHKFLMNLWRLFETVPELWPEFEIEQ